MIDISAQGTTITFSNDSLGKVSFTDVGDGGTVLSFGSLEPMTQAFDLNNQFVIGHRPVAPEFSLGFIPGSASDKKLRAFLLSSLSSNDKIVPKASDVEIQCVVFEIGGEKCSFYDGYLVGGSPQLSVSADGRFTAAPYRFVFRRIGEANGAGTGFSITQLMKDGEDFSDLYYSSVSVSSSARAISHPVETGAVIFDHKYLEPKHVTLRTKVPLAIVDEVEKKFDAMLKDRTLGPSSSSKKTPYSITTKSNSYTNLTLLRYSHEETPDGFDLLDYSLEFQEVIFSSASGYSETRDPANHDSPPVQAVGTQATRPTT